MTISSTKKVGSGGSSTRPEYKASSSNASSFVEAIDAAHSVSVQARLNNDEEQKKHDQYREKEKDSQNIDASTAYISNAIEALAASGVWDEAEHTPSRSVNVYGTNQMIMEEREEEFVEANEII